MLHATQEEFPSLYTKESKPHQKGRKEDSIEPMSLHNEVKVIHCLYFKKA